MIKKENKYDDFLGLMKQAPKSSESKQIYYYNIDKAHFDIKNCDESFMNGLSKDELQAFLQQLNLIEKFDIKEIYERRKRRRVLSFFLGLWLLLQIPVGFILNLVCVFGLTGLFLWEFIISAIIVTSLVANIILTNREFRHSIIKRHLEITAVCDAWNRNLFGKKSLRFTPGNIYIIIIFRCRNLLA